MRYKKPGGGRFGEVRGYYGCPEEQGRGALHLHMVIWVWWYSSPTEFHNRMKCDEEFRRQILEYLTDLIKQNAPEEICSSATSDEVITDAVNEDVDINMKDKDAAIDKPDTVDAPTCTSGTSNLVLSNMTTEGKQIVDSNDTGSSAVMKLDIASINKESFETFTQRPTDPSLTDYETRKKRDVTKVVKHCNTHSHTFTCYKYNHDDCRFGYPRDIVPVSAYIDGEILLQRLDPWINNYEEVTITCTRSNMDIKFIGSGRDCRSLAFYITDYQTKSALSSHNMLPLVAAGLKNCELGETNEEVNTADAVTRSKQMVVKCLNRLSTETEVSGCHVASLLLGHEDKYSSHTFKNLNLHQFLQPIATQQHADEEQEHSESHETLIQWGNNNTLILVNTKTDYLCRGATLESLCLYDYVAKVDKITMSGDRTSNADDEVPKQKCGRSLNMRVRFDKAHPQSKTHIQKLRSVPFVPVLSLFPPSKEANHQKFAQIALLLFKPFVSLSDLCDEDTWEQSYSSYQFEPPQHEILENIQEMHVGMDEKRQRDEERASQQDSTHDDATQYLLGHDPLNDKEEDNVDYVVHIEENVTLDVNTQEVVNIVTNSKQLLNQSQHKEDSCNTPPLVGTANTMELMKTWKKEMKNHRQKVEQEMNTNKPTEQRCNQFDPICVSDTLEDQCHNTSPENITASIVNVQSYEDMAETVATEFTLNTKQYLAFKTITDNTIKRLKGQSVDQMKMYLGGRGGTGKSRVIQAIIQLHETMNIRHTLRIAAFTGTAAANINGSTIHSLTQLHTTNVDMRKLEALWLHVETLLVDEVSMVGCEMLCQLNQRLVLAKHSPSDKAFGGIDVIFVGDFAQFPPIGDYPLYHGSDPDTPLISTTSKPPTQKQIDQAVGRGLWQQLTGVIILTEQMRVTDKVYQELLDRTAIGKGTQQDHEFLHNKVIGEEITLHDTQFIDAPLIVPGNKLVTELNGINAESDAQSSRKQLIINCTIDKCNKMTLTKSKLKQLHKLPFPKTANLPSQCPLFPGMPVKLTENMAVELKLTNSASGIVKEIVCDPREVLSTAKRHTLIYPPLCVIVTFPQTTCPTLKGLEDKDIPVYPVTKTFSYRFPKATRRTRISRTQLPLVPGYSYTAYKSQAQTLPCAAVDLVPPPYMQVRDASFAYVPLSRVRTSDNLALLRPFNISVLQKGKSPDHEAQDIRFAKLSLI